MEEERDRIYINPFPKTSKCPIKNKEQRKKLIPATIACLSFFSE